MGLTPIPLILYGTAEETIRLVFGENYLMVASTFGVLSFCFAFMVVYNVVTGLLSALARPQVVMILALALVSRTGVAHLYRDLTHGLVGVALATTLTWALGTLAGMLYLLRDGCVTLPGRKTVLNVTAGSICSYFITLWVSPHGLWLLIFIPVSTLPMWPFSD